ncbi:hypothetical protein JDV02_006362 [Purpureocillium takamizusanense]|uniref:DUF7918 domain-containing protein n=1 Tax=Purpureocillium takamizusanense TaxID=2060973 RepID=A0A9Q8QG56_9HYPO|nr:uncharacterized protein JDV02_006362 [Purpureocillium takamizusanense]UNI20259.1 hypothetical protein JDV02_006362 [Purpureocillium takamizusanense]
MAVISKIPGLSVSVAVNNEIATEYSTVESEISGSIDGEASAAGDRGEHVWPRTTTYIESYSGAPFRIEATFSAGFQTAVSKHKDHDAISVEVYVDGTWVTSGWAYLESLGKDAPYVIPIENTWTQSETGGLLEERQFAFAPVSRVDDASKQKIVEDSKIAESLGEIIIGIDLMTTVDDDFFDYPENVANPAGVFSLAEKAMKGAAISHGTS